LPDPPSGNDYASEAKTGTSPAEHEFDHATAAGKERLFVGLETVLAQRAAIPQPRPTAWVWMRHPPAACRAATRTVRCARPSRPVGAHELVARPHPSPLGWAKELRAVGPKGRDGLVAIHTLYSLNEHGTLQICALHRSPLRCASIFMVHASASSWVLKRFWPKGPPSLSPGQRPGSGGGILRRPVGPRHEPPDAPARRAPLGRMNWWLDLTPARWAGLRNCGPLARRDVTALWPSTPCTA
jgi:hypothetical protein